MKYKTKPTCGETRKQIGEREIVWYLGRNRVELQWLEDLWKHENMFETEVVRANEYLP